MTFDDAVYDVTVNVTEAASGELVPEVSVFKDGKPVEGVPVFTNRYESTVDYSALGGLKITKVLNGRDMADGQFAFTVKATGDDAEAIAAAASKLGFAEGQTERVYYVPHREGRGSRLHRYSRRTSRWARVHPG